jgi:hypothetical protein
MNRNLLGIQRSHRDIEFVDSTRAGLKPRVHREPPVDCLSGGTASSDLYVRHIGNGRSPLPHLGYLCDGWRPVMGRRRCARSCAGCCRLLPLIQPAGWQRSRSGDFSRGQPRRSGRAQAFGRVATHGPRHIRPRLSRSMAMCTLDGAGRCHRRRCRTRLHRFWRCRTRRADCSREAVWRSPPPPRAAADPHFGRLPVPATRPCLGLVA